MHVCLNVSVCTYMFVSMYVCTCTCIYLRPCLVCPCTNDACIHAFMHALMYVFMYVFMYVLLYEFMLVCVYEFMLACVYAAK